MGTLGIIQALLLHIQGERNPIYVAMRRRSGLPFDAIRGQWQGCLFFALLIMLPILAFIGDYYFGTVSRATIGSIGIAITGLVLSLSWLVPLAMLSCQGISHERASRTWDVLRMTPYPADTILLASAAASIQPVWPMTVGLVFIASLLGICFLPTALVTSLAHGIPPIGGVLLMVAGMVGVIAEREQEIALAVLIGLVVGLTASSGRVATLFGLIGALVFRLFQTLLTLWLMLSLEPLASPNFALLNAAAGTETLIAAAPGFASLVIVLVSIIAREGLIRLLFAWTVRRAREG